MKHQDVLKHRKLTIRFFLDGTKQKKTFPDTTDRCWRCQKEKGTMLHIFWDCPRLKSFWGEILKILQRFTDSTIPEEPAFCLLHVNDLSEKAYKESIICHLLDAAKACIPLKWKSTLPPTIQMWVCRVREISRLEDLVLSSRHQQERYSGTWGPWNAFLASDEGKLFSTMQQICRRTE